MTGTIAQTRGALIVFEGIDRCGKTTQSTKLMEYLASKNVSMARTAWGSCYTGMLRRLPRCARETHHTHGNT